MTANAKKKVINVIFNLGFFLFCSLNLLSILNAQISSGGNPISLSLKLPQNIHTVTMSTVDVEALLAEDAVQQAEGLPFRFGTGFEVNYGLDNSGIWTNLPDGGRLWRLRIVTPGAFSINMIYSEFWLPPGAQLFIYNADASMVLGAFTEKNNKEHGQFATGLVKGPVTILEYYEPADVAGSGTLTISHIVHGYRNMFASSTMGGVLGKVLDFGDSGDCNNNAYNSLSTDWLDEIRSVGLIMLWNNTRICSGALINNVREDHKPYFLTANHCWDPSANTWIVMFNYEANYEATGQVDPITQPLTTAEVSGTVLKARNSDTDFMLLELSSAPSAHYNVFYSGWYRVNAISSSTVGIHHPSGDIKKISFDDDYNVSDDYGGSGVPDSHWKVIWDDGTTEGISSGSPLFDTSHRIVGQLHGGAASCAAPNAPDWYGKFSMSWDRGSSASTRLKDWLDPDNTGAYTLNGIDYGISGTVPIDITWRGKVNIVGNTTVLDTV